MAVRAAWRLGAPRGAAGRKWHRGALPATAATQAALVAAAAGAYVGVMTREDQEHHLAGMLLVAMPGMPDPRFAHSVIYLCAHSAEGAMGLVVNQVADEVSFPSVIGQLGLEADERCADTPVHVGGPVQPSRGFVLHSADYVQDSTLVIDERFALTATVDVLRAIAEGTGPGAPGAGAGLCRLAGGPARRRDPGQWLAPGAGRPRDRVRPRQRRASGCARCARSASTRRSCRARPATPEARPAASGQAAARCSCGAAHR